MQVNPGMSNQELLDFDSFVRGPVVEDKVEIQIARGCFSDLFKPHYAAALLVRAPYRLATSRPYTDWLHQSIVWRRPTTPATLFAKFESW